MLTFGFYNSKNGDRKYDAEQIGAMFNGLITDGVFANYKEALRVTSGNEKREIVVRPGRAWFNGTWTEVDDSGHSIRLGTSFTAADTFYICLAVYKKSRVNSIAYYKDIPENNPDTGLYYYLLAQINIPAGSDRVMDSMITDMRGSDRCPYVTGIMETVSFEELVKRVCGDSWQDWLGAYEAGITTGVQNAVATSNLALDEVRSMKSYAVESEDVSYIWAKFEAVPTGGGGFEWVTDSVHTELTDPPMPVCLFRDLSYADLGPGFKPSVSLGNPYIDYGETYVKAIPAVTQSKVWREYPYFWEGGADNGTDVLRYDHLQRVVVNVGGTASEKYSYRTSRLMRIPVVYEPGVYIGTVDADSATAYPKDGYRDGYYYIRFASRAEDVSFYYPGLSAKNVRDAIVEVVNTGGTGSGTAMPVIEVEELPSTGIKGVFYIVKKPGDSDASEYLWLDRWEKVGGAGSAQNAVLYTEQELTSEQMKQARLNIGAANVSIGENTTQCKLSYWIVNAGKISHDPNGRGCFIKVKENTQYKITVKGEHNRFYINGCMVEEVLISSPATSIYSSGSSAVTTETETYTFDSADYKSIVVTVAYGMTDPDISVEITEINNDIVAVEGIPVYTTKKVDQMMDTTLVYTEQELTPEQKEQARKNIGAIGITADMTTQGEVGKFFATSGKIAFNDKARGCFIKVKENTQYKITVKGEHNRFYINGCMLDAILTGAEAPSIYNSGRNTITTETEIYTIDSGDYKSIMVTVCFDVPEPNVSVEYTEVGGGTVKLDEIEVYTAKKVDQLMSGAVMHVEQSLTEDQKVQARENIGAVGVKTFDPVQYEPSHYFVNMNKINYSTNGLGCFIKVKENTLYKVTVKGEHNRFFINGCMLDEVQTGAEAPTIYSSGLSDVTTETETYTFNSAGYKSIMVTVAYGLTNPVISVEIVETTDGIIDFDGTEVYTSEKVDRLIAPLVIDGLVYTTPSDLDGVTKTEEVYALYDALVTKHPAYVAKNVLGQNSEGTDICEYVFTTGDYNAVDALRTKDPVIPKPTVLVISGIHGDERSAVKSTYQFFRDLANFSPILYQLREGITFKVIPVATPGALDRGKRVNENGVNVNRNFDYEWSATANDGMNYAGAAATDQAETQILQAWFGENESAALLVDHHNSGYPNEVSMVYGNESEMMPEIKRLYLQGTARVIPYWKTKKGFPDDLIFAYTGYLNAGGVLIDYAQYGKGIPSICMETSWNQNSLGQHSAETVAVGAEALGNMLLAMYDKFESLRSRNLSQDGEDGFSPSATVSQTADGATITITDKNGTTTATLTNGTDGDAGGYYLPLVTQPEPGAVQFAWKASTEGMQPWPPIGMELPAGKDGSTPVKGVDYYTEADRDEMVAAVLARIEDGNGVAY